MQFIVVASASGLSSLVILGASGAFGSIAEALSVVGLKNVHDASGSAERPITAGAAMTALVSLAIGVLSSLAVAPIMMLGESVNSNESELFLLAKGVLSGFFGARILRVSTGMLVKQMEVESKGLGNERVAFPSAEIAASLVDGLNVLSADNERLNGTELEAAIRQLERARAEIPVNRQIGIILGRLYRRRGDLPRAIAVLTEVIGARTAHFLPERDTAALFYNRACYRHMLSQAINSDEERLVLRKLAKADLTEAIRQDPSNAESAMYDVDLQGIAVPTALAENLSRVSAQVQEVQQLLKEPTLPAYAGYFCMSVLEGANGTRMNAKRRGEFEISTDTKVATLSVWLAATTAAADLSQKVELSAGEPTSPVSFDVRIETDDAELNPTVASCFPIDQEGGRRIKFQVRFRDDQSRVEMWIYLSQSRRLITSESVILFRGT